MRKFGILVWCMEQMSLYLWIKPMRQWMKVAELG